MAVTEDTKLHRGTNWWGAFVAWRRGREGALVDLSTPTAGGGATTVPPAPVVGETAR
jgi:hypothetical protein